MSLGFPLAKINRVRVRETWSERFSFEGKRRCYVVVIEASNPTMIRGNVLPYKGSYKERAEAVAQRYLDEVQRGATIHIEIVGPEGMPLDGLISIPNLIKSGKASASSPLVQTARRYGIHCALIHGRHLIGPSPALAQVVRQIATTATVRTALELFGGTGIAAKVICQHGAPIKVTIIEIDHTKTQFLRSHLDDNCVRVEESDVFTYPIDTHFNLIVADPFYEQVLDLLKVHGAAISMMADRFVLACGSVEDVTWNRMIRSRLVGLGFGVRRHAKFGQVIFECVPSRLT